MKSRFMVVTLLLAFGLSSMAIAADDDVVHSKSKSKKQGWLGVSIQDVTPRLARDKELKVKEGAYVNEVVEESPADSVGIEEGDVITEFNGKKIELAEDLTKEVRETKPGTKVNLNANRNGEKKTFAVNIGRNKMHRLFGMSMPHPMNIPHPKKIIFRNLGTIEGMELMELNKQLGEYFEAPNGRGVLVKEVEKESNAAKAGMKAGDVITKVGDETIKDIDDIHDALEDAEEGGKLNVELIRKGKKSTVLLEISEGDYGDIWKWNERGPEEDFEFQFAPKMDLLQEGIEMKLRQLPDIHRKIKELKVLAPHAEV